MINVAIILIGLSLITTDPQSEPHRADNCIECQYEATGEITELGQYLGGYTLTAYCACEQCCGKSDGITASGTVATQGRTVACNSLPFGTVLSINGHEYTVEDTGGMRDGVIDVFFDDHQEAIEFGVQYADVYKVVN